MSSADLPTTIRIGGEIEVNRLGFGAMRITGPGTSKVSHLEENVAATGIRLSDRELESIGGGAGA